jgi:hyperosmotically inducible periplasmic protein
MKNTNTSLKCLSVLTLLVVGLGLTGCKSDDRSMAEKWGDRQVARGVKKELSKDPMYHYTDVVPVVHDGVVQLTGFVDTPEQRQRAAQLAAQAKGATQVINTIELKPTPTGRPTGRATNAPPQSVVPGTPAPIHDPQSNP